MEMGFSTVAQIIGIPVFIDSRSTKGNKMIKKLTKNFLVSKIRNHLHIL